jgi:hypothetical protein
MNPLDGNVKGDRTCRGCEGSGTAISMIGLLSDKGTEVGVSVDGSDVGVAAGATDIDKTPEAIRSNAMNIERNSCNIKI